MEPFEYKTVREAIGDLPPVPAGVAYPGDPMHKSAAHKESTLEVIRQVPHDGGSRPAGIGPKCLDKTKGIFRMSTGGCTGTALLLPSLIMPEIQQVVDILTPNRIGALLPVRLQFDKASQMDLNSQGNRMTFTDKSAKPCHHF